MFKESTGAKCAEQIIKDFIFHDEAKNVKKTLTVLFYEWVQSEIDYDREQRYRMLLHYRMLQDFLTDAEKLQNERRAAV